MMNVLMKSLGFKRTLIKKILTVVTVVEKLQMLLQLDGASKMFCVALSSLHSELGNTSALSLKPRSFSLH